MAKKAAQKKADAAKNDPSDIASTAPPNNPTKMIIADSGLAFVVYILYLFGYFTGITAIICVIIAYLQARSANPPIKSHYTFQIRTFWIGLVYLVVSLLFLGLAIGVLILLWGFVWSLVRNVKGLLALNSNNSIQNPKSWMFGDRGISHDVRLSTYPGGLQDQVAS